MTNPTPRDVEAFLHKMHEKYSNWLSDETTKVVGTLPPGHKTSENLTILAELVAGGMLQACTIRLLAVTTPERTQALLEQMLETVQRFAEEERQTTKPDRQAIKPSNSPWGKPC